MDVTLYGATGRAGSRIATELLRRGHEVRAVARTPQTQTPADNVTWVVDDLSDTEKTADTIRGTDAVISAYAPPPEDLDALVTATSRLAEAASIAAVPRLLVVGGAGGLFVAPGVTLLQSGHLPEAWVGLATAHGKALDALKSTTIDWTYIAPAGFFEPGERTGHYRTDTDNLVVGANGESRISMEDYAIAMADELENPKHSRGRLAVGW